MRPTPAMLVSVFCPVKVLNADYHMEKQCPQVTSTSRAALQVLKRMSTMQGRSAAHRELDLLMYLPFERFPSTICSLTACSVQLYISRTVLPVLHTIGMLELIVRLKNVKAHCLSKRFMADMSLAGNMSKIFIPLIFRRQIFEDKLPPLACVNAHPTAPHRS